MSVETASKILQLFILIGLGFLLKKLRVLHEADAPRVVTLNTYTFLPALIFYVIYTSNFKNEYIGVPLSGFAVMLVMTVISGLFAFISGFRDKKFAMPFVVASSAGNTGYIGYPVCLALFGQEGLTIAVAYDIFATVFYALIIAAALISYGSGKMASLKQLFYSLLTFPPTIAAILGLAVKGIQVPGFLLETLEFASSAAIPLTLVSLGIAIREKVNFHYFKYVFPALILKLGVSPLIAWVVASWFLTGLPLKIAVIQASMPSLMLTYILSERYGTAPEFASFLVFASTLTGIITIPIVVSLVG